MPFILGLVLLLVAQASSVHQSFQHKESDHLSLNGFNNISRKLSQNIYKKNGFSQTRSCGLIPDLSQNTEYCCLGQDFTGNNFRNNVRVYDHYDALVHKTWESLHAVDGDRDPSLPGHPYTAYSQEVYSLQLSHESIRVAAGLVATISSVVLIIFGVYTRVRKTNKSADQNHDALSSVAAEEIGCSARCLKFDISTIKVATNNFSKKNKIGESTIIGDVYRGKLHTGQQIAVKCIYFNRSQQHREYFKNEVQHGAKFLHRNLVKLLGFSSKGDESFLVYEFFPMRLDRLLFGRLKVEHRQYLNWDGRYKIIKGIASVLFYLHEESGSPTINGDIKASKVFLDENLNPKILGFGSTKYFGVSQNDQVATNKTGSFEYLDPEYLKSGVITFASDVFSFGVLLLEIISGKKSGCFRLHTESFINYASRNWFDGTVSDLVDPKIRDGISKSEIIRCIHIALLCVRAEENSRPSMSSVFLMLNHNPLHLPTLLEVPKDNDTEGTNIESNDSVSSSDSDSGPTESLSDRSDESYSSALEISFNESELLSHDHHVNVGFIDRFCFRNMVSIQHLIFRKMSSLRYKIVGNNDRNHQRELYQEQAV